MKSRSFFKSFITGIIFLLLVVGFTASHPTSPAVAATTNYSEVVTGVQALPFTFSRTITATATPVTFRIPFKAKVLGVSVHAKVIDLTDTNETYTVDIKEGGTSILSSAISIAAADTIYEGTVSDTTLADESTITAVVTLGGTTPSVTDITVLLTLRRTN